MQLEQLIGVAEKNSLISSFVQRNLNREKVQGLLELAAQANPVVQKLVQRILQILLRMGISQELFENAIALSDRVDNRGHPTKLRQLLNMDSVLKFPESMFLQVLCNLVQLNMEKAAVRDNPVSFKSRDAMFEVGRTLRTLQLYPMLNIDLGTLF